MPRQPRERTKTFTGCWTCRSRKLKCDEQKPHCWQCTSKHLECAGYGTRLRWLPPDSTGMSRLPSTAGTGGFQRGNVCSRASIIPSAEIEIDNALYQIELDTPVSFSTTCRGPFSVFNIRTKEAPQYSHTVSAVPESGSYREGYMLDDYLNGTAVGEYELPKRTAKNVEESSSCSTPVSPRCLQHIGPLSTFRMSEDLFAPPTSDNLTLNSDHSISNPLSSHIIRRRSPSLPDSNVFNRSFERSFMTPEVRYLLGHYMNHVIDIMTVVSNRKSPWKSLHLPRALQGCGELEAVGITSNARNALINALLSISAFNLAQKLGGCNTTEAEKWSKAAQKHRFRAVNFLKQCLEVDFKQPSKVKYKEILAAMLSMVTIDVISGDTRTCQIHIAGCKSLIEASKQNMKRTYSAKARALHRVFLFLWIIQESTALSYDSIKFTEEDDSFPRTSPESTAKWLATQKESTPELEDSTCELVYGVQQELFVLLGRTTALVRQMRSYLKTQADMSLPPNLIERCKILENDILEWPVDTILYHGSISSLDRDTQKIISHQTHSFHQSIIIFFSQHVRSIHRQHLQPYVHRVIDHVEAIEDIKHRIGITAGPILWPGFVAASEAIGTTLQERFSRWFSSLEGDYGLGNVSAAKAVIEEVWKRRKGTEESAISDWRIVAESQKVYLMLT